MRDVEIVKLFMKRDERAIAELEGQYGRRLFRAAERLLSREDAEECVNDTWLQVWNHIPPDEPTRFPSASRIRTRILKMRQSRT